MFKSLKTRAPVSLPNNYLGGNRKGEGGEKEFYNSLFILIKDQQWLLKRVNKNECKAITIKVYASKKKQDQREKSTHNIYSGSATYPYDRPSKQEHVLITFRNALSFSLIGGEKHWTQGW